MGLRYGFIYEEKGQLREVLQTFEEKEIQKLFEVYYKGDFATAWERIKHDLASKVRRMD